MHFHLFEVKKVKKIAVPVAQGRGRLPVCTENDPVSLIG